MYDGVYADDLFEYGIQCDTDRCAGIILSFNEDAIFTFGY